MLEKCRKCKTYSYHHRCYANFNGDCLNDLSDLVPDEKLISGKERIEQVSVQNIVGTHSSLKRDQFKSDWSPRKLNVRYKRLHNRIKEEGFIKRGEPTLSKFKGKYYVGDGFRRASVAKMLGIKSIQAWVIPLTLK